jgi:hypothetical protein
MSENDNMGSPIAASLADNSFGFGEVAIRDMVKEFARSAQTFNDLLSDDCARDLFSRAWFIRQVAPEYLITATEDLYGLSRAAGRSKEDQWAEVSVYRAASDVVFHILPRVVRASPDLFSDLGGKEEAA